MSFVFKLLGAVFLAQLLGVLSYTIAVTYFAIEIVPEDRVPTLFVIAISNLFASIASIVGYRLGGRVFEGSAGFFS